RDRGAAAHHRARAAEGDQGMSVFSKERRIRFSDCDPAGIVFYPQYFVMFNGLVEDWFNESLRVDYRQLVMERRVGLPTVRLEAGERRGGEGGRGRGAGEGVM